MTVLRFVLEIETRLGDGDAVEPSVDYVTEWLTHNEYDSRLIKAEIIDD
jgi:hypothetical protein